MSVDAPATRADPVRLLTVCTGNICRSPYAAALRAPMGDHDDEDDFKPKTARSRS